MPTFTLGVLLAAGIAAAAGAVRTIRATRALYPEPLPPPAGDPSDPAVDHEPAHPTAAMLLVHAGTEVSNFLLPHGLLASSRAFNIHAAGPERRPEVLTGGLDVVPHLGIGDVASLPSDRLDLVVVPHLPDPDDQLIGWLREQYLSVQLEDQVDEVALAADMDTFAATFAGCWLTVTPDGRAVPTGHVLTVVPRASAATAPALPRSSPARTAGPPYAAFQRTLDGLADLGGPAIERFAAKRLGIRRKRPTNTTPQNEHTRRTG